MTIKKSAKNKAGEGVEKRECLYTVGRNVNWCSHYGKQYGMSLKKKKQLKIEMPYNLAEFLRWLSSKESACGAEDTGDLGSIPGLGRLPGSPVQYSCLENPIDRGDWWAIVHRVAKSQTQLKQLNMYSHTHAQSQS